MLSLNNNLFWMLFFFVIFYVYVDMRFHQIRKELLNQYFMCEKLLTEYKLADKMTLRNIVPLSNGGGMPTKPVQENFTSLPGFNISVLELEDMFAPFTNL